MRPTPLRFSISTRGPPVLEGRNPTLCRTISRASIPLPPVNSGASCTHFSAIRRAKLGSTSPFLHSTLSLQVCVPVACLSATPKDGPAPEGSWDNICWLFAQSLSSPEVHLGTLVPNKYCLPSSRINCEVLYAPQFRSHYPRCIYHSCRGRRNQCECFANMIQMTANKCCPER